MKQVTATVIVERNQLLRDALSRVIGGEQFRIIAAVPCLRHVNAELISQHPSVFIVLGLTSRPQEVIQDIVGYREERPADQIVVLSDADNCDLALAVMRAGCKAYLDEVAAPEILLEALDIVLAGEAVVPAGCMSRLLAEAGGATPRAPAPSMSVNRETILVHGPQLSDRELAVLNCLVEGNTNKVIARKVDMAEATVKVHVKAILRKIRVKNRTQAAIWALNNRHSSSTYDDLDLIPTHQA